MIDWDFEDRLIERVQARAAIADALDPRQRRLLRAHLQGATQQEIAKAEGISVARVSQINERSIWRLQKWARGWRPPPPPPPKPPPKPKLKPRVNPAAARERLLAKEQRILRTMLQREEADRRAEALRRQVADAQRKVDEAHRRLREATEQRICAQERADWIRALQVAISACDGTHYAVLIPQMLADIANINAQPPGALPWRFDRTAFQRHFASFQAQVDAGTYRRV